MGWFDKLLYNLGQASPVGRAIEGGKQDDRLAQLANSYNAAPNLDQFAEIQAPGYSAMTGTSDPRFLNDPAFKQELVDNGLKSPETGIYSPDHLTALEKVKQGRLALLQQQGAAPVTAEATRLNRMAANDDYVGSPEGLADFAQRPGFWLDAPDTGAVSGAKKGMIATALGYNPKIADAVNAFGDRNQNILDRFKASEGNQMALARLDKDSSLAFKEGQQGLDQINTTNDRNFKMNEATDKLDREKAAMKAYNETPVTTAPADMERFKAVVRQAGGTADASEPLLKRFEALNDPYKNMNEADLTLKSINGDTKAQAVLDRMQNRKKDIALDSRTVVVNNPLPTKMDMNKLTDEQSAALTRHIALGLVDPYKVNSRNQQVLAAAALANPNLNLNEIASKLGMQRNVKVQDKAGNAAILPDMVKDVAESGKKLKYSDNAVIGKAGQWLDKLNNNPDYINYAAKRNDIIMRIGGVMRENGMTDQAQKLEEDSAPKSMSPRAFDAWAEAQMSVLNPILKKYTSQATGKGTPMGSGGLNLDMNAIDAAIAKKRSK